MSGMSNLGFFTSGSKQRSTLSFNHSEQDSCLVSEHRLMLVHGRPFKQRKEPRNCRIGRRPCHWLDQGIY